MPETSSRMCAHLAGTVQLLQQVAGRSRQLAGMVLAALLHALVRRHTLWLLLLLLILLKLRGAIEVVELRLARHIAGRVRHNTIATVPCALHSQQTMFTW